MISASNFSNSHSVERTMPSSSGSRKPGPTEIGMVKHSYKMLHVVAKHQKISSSSKQLKSSMPPSVQWEIVGGSDKGGILVRDDESTKSAQTGRTSEASFF